MTLIASASDGAKDLVPAKIYVAYSAPRADGPPPALIAAANRSSSSNEKSDKSESQDKQLSVHKVATVPKKVEKKAEKKPVKTEPKHSSNSTNTASNASSGESANPPAQSTPTATTTVKHPLTKRTTAVAYNAGGAKDDEGTTTVVSEKTSGVLHVDIDLEHI